MSTPLVDENQKEVCAVVVAFNRQEKLRECLRALQGQTRALDEILVINNASTDGTSSMVKNEFPAVKLLDLAENGGGAGGFHAGMKQAFDQGFMWLWLMDDDVIASPDVCELMMRQSAHGDVLVPLQKDSVGRLYGVAKWTGRLVEITSDVLAKRRPLVGDYLFSFAGPMISRRVIETVGLPRAEFFIWFDDAEYSLRVHDANLKVRVVPDAILFHDVGGHPKINQLLGKTLVRIVPPSWKLYYGTRNMLWVLLRQKVSLRRRQRMMWQFLLTQGYQSLQEILFEPDRKQRLKMRWRGVKDGIRGNLGRRN